MSPKKPKTHKMVSANDLLIALAATAEPIRLRNGETDTSSTISPESAIRLVLRASHGYEGKVTKSGRVIWMRPTTGKPVELDPRHWDGRACIRFWADETNQLAKVRNARISAIWDEVVANPPRWMKRPV